MEKERGALRIVALDRHAATLGLAPGLTLADARARVPDLAAEPARPEEDRIFLIRLAGWAERFTPLVALDPPDGLLLDITGCGHLFGGEVLLLAAVRRPLGASGLGHRAAIAGTPDAARALARFGAETIVPPGRDEAAVRPLPVTALGMPPETTTALLRAGLATIGDLADRRPEALTARFGAGLVTRLHAVLGRVDHRITPLRAPPDCVVARNFAEPLIDAAALEIVVADLVAEAAATLEQRGEGGRRFEFLLFRADGGLRRLALETGRPARDIRAILRLWRERVETLADPLEPGFGFDAVRLEIPHCEKMPQAQASLDGRATTSDGVAELIDRLSTRFGRDRVLRFVRRDTYDPRREVRAIPAITATPSTPWPAPEPGEPPARPLQLFEPPHAVETLAEVPDAPPRHFRWRGTVHAVVRAEGPERIAPEWWRDAAVPVRDYYRVEDADGHRFWLFRAGLHGEGAAPRWFLHGLFA